MHLRTERVVFCTVTFVRCYMYSVTVILRYCSFFFVFGLHFRYTYMVLLSLESFYCKPEVWEYSKFFCQWTKSTKTLPLTASMWMEAIVSQCDQTSSSLSAYIRTWQEKQRPNHEWVLSPEECINTQISFSGSVSAVATNVCLFGVAGSWRRGTQRSVWNGKGLVSIM